MVRPFLVRERQGLFAAVTVRNIHGHDLDAGVALVLLINTLNLRQFSPTRQAPRCPERNYGHSAVEVLGAQRPAIESGDDEIRSGAVHRLRALTAHQVGCHD
jgi:hypothetical protein